MTNLSKINFLDLFCFSFLLISISCSQPEKQQEEEPAQQVEIITDMGTIVLRLYNETPLHRDNFIKLVNEQFYDSILFHRVIQNFMIQSGDPDSKVAEAGDELGSTDLPYTIPAEFGPNLFHKRGALGAARDGNPARASSSTQFYIVQGRVYSDSLLAVQEGRINTWLSMNRVVNDPLNKAMLDRRDQLRDENPESDSIQLISDALSELATINLESSEKYKYPEAHQEVYKTIGGAAHLDQNYTVFGEVVSGMEVIDKIAAAAANDADRPVEDIKIITARLVENKE
ncbi:MAG: peptidylprolyl isomerase [Cyclobacteriaceae bacterium]